jgi:serine protease Do
MKNIPILSVLAALLCAPAGGRAAPDVPAEIKRAIDEVAARIKPALVQVYVVTTQYQQGRELKYQASGSGVIIDEEGYVLSNHHVAGRATRLVCVLSNNEEIEADLVGTDALSDISLLKLRPKTPRTFPFAPFGDSDTVEVGDMVLAMGSPMALSQSVTLGIVSNTKMVLPRLFWPFDKFTLDGENVGSIVRWIGHDAAIYGGNSGGPLVNLNGEVVGINEISLGLSGAIPGNLAREVGRQLKQYGQVRRAWLGIDIQPMLKSAGDGVGALVSGTIPDSPAEQAGFAAGDILLSLAGGAVSIRYNEEIPLFNQRVADLPIDQPVDAVVRRGGSNTTLRVTPILREEVKPRDRELRDWGITARDISFLAAKELKLKDRDGVLVTSISPGGPAGEAKPSIQVQDILVRVDGQAVADLAALEAATAKARAGRDEPTPVIVDFRRKGDDYMTVVKLGRRDLEDPGAEARKAWLPVNTQVITRDIARQLGDPELRGVRVTQVYTDSTAEQAGLRVGDLLVELDGEPIPAAQPEDYEVFSTRIRQYRVGARPTLTVRRDGESLSLAPELVASPKLEREMKKYRDDPFDFTVRDVTFFDRAREDWGEEQGGVMVSAVEPGGWAAIGRLGVSDLIVEVHGERIRDVAGLEAVMKKISADKPDLVVYKVLRGIHTLYLEMEPSWK